MRSIFFTICALCSFTFPALAAPRGKTTKVIFFQSPTAEAGYLKSFEEGMRLALAEIVDKGVLKEGTLSLEMKEFSAEPSQQEIGTIEELLTEKKFSAGLTADYQLALRLAPIFEKHKSLLIELTASSPEMSSKGKTTFTLGPWLPGAGKLAANYAFHDLEARTAVIIHSASEWSRFMAQAFEEEFRYLTGSILQTILLPESLEGLNSFLEALKPQRPGVVYAPLTERFLDFHKELKRVGLKRFIISSDRIPDALVQQHSQYFEDLYLTGIRFPRHYEARLLFRRYRAQYDKQVEAPWRVATGYDSLMLIAEALHIAERAEVELSEAFGRISNFQGASQTISFRERAASPYPSAMFQVKSGDLVLLQAKQKPSFH